MEVAVPEAVAPRSRAEAGGGWSSFLGILGCFFLSGFAALVYQTAWMRQFSIVFGTSELAVAAVLAAYMAGLAGGAALAAGFVERVRRPVLVYGLLELGIALGALAVPYLLSFAKQAMVAWIGGQPAITDEGASARTLFYLGWAFLVIFVPTALMGATLPLLARGAVHTDAEVGRRVGILYAVNTAGAVLGAIVAAFSLLPALGLARTVWVGVGLNAVVFLLAVVLSRRRAGPTPSRSPAERASLDAPSPEAGARIRRAALVLPLMLVSGMVSFTYEVLWTRLLSHLLGGSLYAFAVMLASFLSGIAIGSAIAAPIARTRALAARGLAIAQAGIALASIVIYLSLDSLPALAAKVGTGEAGGIGGNAFLAAIVLFPATLFLGATFPFALRLLARDESDAARASARVYAWNTLGAIAGAVLAGFLVIPALGYAGTVRLAVWTNLVLACIAALLWSSQRRALLVTTGGLALLALLFFHPGAPERLMRSSSLAGVASTGAIVYQGVGRSASVVLLEQQGTWEVRCNGLPEATIEPRGAPPFGRNTTWWLGALPLLARPAARTMLVIGFGGGVTMEYVPSSVETIDTIELEPEVIAANRHVSALRAHDPLADPRVHVHMGDARGALALTSERWDVIVSQPSHPWTAGASHLYTREFLQEARAHLAEGGVFVQWMLSGFLDEELLRVLAATILDVFPHARLYQPIPPMLVFLASDSPLEPERELARTGEPLRSAPEHWARMGIHGVSDVVAMLALEEDRLRELAGGARVNTDDENVLALRRVQGRGRALGFDLLDALLAPGDAIANPASPLSTALGEQVDRMYLAVRMAELGLSGRMQRLLEKLDDQALQLLTQARLAAVGGGQLEEAAQAAQEVLQRDPRNLRARYMMVRPFLRRPEDDAQQRSVLSAAASLTGASGAVVKGMRALTSGEWTKLPALEAQLASARVVDPWYWDAAALRAQLRVQGVSPEGALKAGPEALGIVDRALAVHPDVECLVARAEIGRRADMPDVLVETTAELLRLLVRHELSRRQSGEPFLHESQLELVRETLRSIEPTLAPIRADPRVTPARVDAVGTALRSMVPAAGTPPAPAGQ